MINEITFNPHEKILKGVDKLADTVQETLGPSGRNVVIYKKRGFLVTKDGVTVARNITLRDDLENLGAMMVKEVAGKSNDLAGDGTTTATVLARSIYKEGLKYLVAGHNPIDLKRSIDEVVEKIVQELSSKKRKIETEKEIYNVALISTNNDADLSRLIANAIFRVGMLGSISVEDSKTDETELKFVEGLQLERGLISKYFCNDITRLRATYDKPRFLICNHEIDDLKALMPVLEYINKTKEPLVILAHEYEDNVLAALIANKMKANLKIICLHTPGSGDYKPDYMEDLAKATDSIIFQPDYKPMLEDFDPEYLGRADKIVSDVYETSVIGLQPIDDHVKNLEKSINEITDKFYLERLKDRYARLTSGIAILSLASVSDTEHKDKKLRVEDAINATKAAVKDGILPGGGIALYKSKMYGSIANDIINKALETPLKAILKNAAKPEQEILMKVNDSDKFEHGYNVRTNEYGDLYELGVPDPFLVVKSSLTNAASVAGMLLTTSCCVHQEEQKEDK